MHALFVPSATNLYEVIENLGLTVAPNG
jgi:hypothetical protein